MKDIESISFATHEVLQAEKDRTIKRIIALFLSFIVLNNALWLSVWCFSKEEVKNYATVEEV